MMLFIKLSFVCPLCRIFSFYHLYPAAIPRCSVRRASAAFFTLSVIWPIPNSTDITGSGISPSKRPSSKNIAAGISDNAQALTTEAFLRNNSRKRAYATKHPPFPTATAVCAQSNRQTWQTIGKWNTAKARQPNRPLCSIISMDRLWKRFSNASRWKTPSKIVGAMSKTAVINPQRSSQSI